MPHADNRHWMSLVLGRDLPEAPKRTEVADLVASRAMWDLSHLNQDLPSVAAFDESVVIASDREDPLIGELTVPFGEGPFPALIYLHGGGWCAGNAANERKIARRFATSGHIVLALDYRLAPEHPFPAAIEDVLLAARWLAGEGRSRAEEGRIALGGQSAGANLAAAAAAALVPGGAELRADIPAAASEANIELSALVLFSGIYSWPLMLEQPGSNVGPIELWHQAYLGPDFLRRSRHPLVSPLFAPNLDAFPPTFLSCGDEDSFLGQTLEFAAALAQSNVATTVSVLAGIDHGLPYLDHLFPDVAADLDRMTRWLAGHTGADPHQQGAPK